LVGIVSNGPLVSLIACDEPKIARKVAEQLRGFKMGSNTMRPLRALASASR
jgi:hypothetical protein